MNKKSITFNLKGNYYLSPFLIKDPVQSVYDAIIEYNTTVFTS